MTKQRLPLELLERVAIYGDSQLLALLIKSSYTLRRITMNRRIKAFEGKYAQLNCSKPLTCMFKKRYTNMINDDPDSLINVYDVCYNDNGQLRWVRHMWQGWDAHVYVISYEATTGSELIEQRQPTFHKEVARSRGIERPETLEAARYFLRGIW